MTQDRWWSISGWIVGVAALLFSVWVYFHSVPVPSPTFYVDPTRSTVVDAHADAATDLEISFHGQPLKGISVSSLQVYFWNAGKQPIRPGDILRPLRVELPAGTRLLTAKVVRVTRDVCGFRISPVVGAPNAVDITMDIAEKNDGLRLQLTYSGPVDSMPTFTGTTVGAASPQLEKMVVRKHEETPPPSRWFAIGNSVFALATLTVTTVFAVRRAMQRQPRNLFFTIMAAAMVLVVILQIGMLGNLFLNSVSPPTELLTR